MLPARHHWLFDERVLAGVDCRRRHLAVQRVRRRNDDRVYASILKQTAVVGIPALAAALLGLRASTLLVTRARSDEAHVPASLIQSRGLIEEALRDLPAADHPEAQLGGRCGGRHGGSYHTPR